MLVLFHFIFLLEGLRFFLWSEFYFSHFLLSISSYCFAHLFLIFEFLILGILSQFCGCDKKVTFLFDTKMSKICQRKLNSVSFLLFHGCILAQEFLLSEVFLIFVFLLYIWIYFSPIHFEYLRSFTKFLIHPLIQQIFFHTHLHISLVNLLINLLTLAIQLSILN